jgi:alcohol dehydrogenase
MRALMFEGGRRTLADLPRPEPTGECLIRVRLAGICGTDLQLLDGYADFAGVPGHEFVGTVESVSRPEDERWIGRRVVGEINVGCGECPRCRSGLKEHCGRRSVLGIRGRPGAFAEYVSLPADNLHTVPPHVDDETAVFAEPVAAACRILEQVRLDGGARVAVLGDGRLGLLAAQVLRHAGATVRVLGRHAQKIQTGRALDLDAALDDGAAPAEPYEIVVEATGRPAGLPRALALVRPRGTVVLKSTFHGEAPLELWPAVVHEVSIVGSRCGPFAPALALLASGAVRVAPLVQGVYALDDHDEAFRVAARGLKVLLKP